MIKLRGEARDADSWRNSWPGKSKKSRKERDKMCRKKSSCGKLTIN
jgi:hypothetical protein